MIDIIWGVIDRFIEEWRNSPYEWQTEIDIQSDIASRLRKYLKEDGMLLQEAKYDYIREGILQPYSRVGCEWATNYNDSKGERCYCHPDIVVYDDIADPNNPPDVDRMKNWPILWVCEIKYQTEDNSPQYGEWDIEKMEYLLGQGETKFACSLYFNRKRIDKGLIKPIEKRCGRFRLYDVLPKK